MGAASEAAPSRWPDPDTSLLDMPAGIAEHVRNHPSPGNQYAAGFCPEKRVNPATNERAPSNKRPAVGHPVPYSAPNPIFTTFAA